MSDKLYSLIAGIMNIPIEQINDQSGPESIPSWTSFSGYVLLSELESEFNTKFSIDEVISVIDPETNYKTWEFYKQVKQEIEKL